MGNSTDGHGAAGELLPCPFCGCQVTDADVDDENEYTAFTPYYRVVCLGCGSMCDGHEDCGAAVMNWNRRASVPNTGTALSEEERQRVMEIRARLLAASVWGYQWGVQQQAQADLTFSLAIIDRLSSAPSRGSEQ